jgi:hypothetical protein
MYIHVLLLQQLQITSLLQTTIVKQEREEELTRRGKVLDKRNTFTEIQE